MTNNFEPRFLFKNLIQKKSITEFESYIKESADRLKILNNEHFDILIFSIEVGASLETLKLIIDKGSYNTLNYTITEQEVGNSNGLLGNQFYSNYKTPLFTAISSENFEVANLLIKNQADINYNIITDFNENAINVISYLSINHSLNNKKLNYILSHGFNIKNITTKLITNVIDYKKEIKNNLLETIFNHYIFDNDFILSLLYHYKNQRILSNEQLFYLITKEKSKIKINDTMYDYVVKNSYYKNNDALYTLLVYDSSESTKLLGRIQNYHLFEIAIEKNDYYFVKKILNYVSWDLLKHINFQNILIKAIQKEKYDIVKLLLESLIKQPLFDFKTINFEEILLEGIQTKNVNIMLLIVDALLGFRKDINLSFKEIIILTEFYHNISNTNIKENQNNKTLITTIQYLLKTLLNHSSLNISQNITFENILFMTNFHGNMNNLKFIINHLLNSDSIDFSNFKLSELKDHKSKDHPYIKKNKIEVINLFIENIVDILLNNLNQLKDTLIIEKWIISYLTSVLTIAIKLGNLKSIKTILENDKLKSFININAEDKNKNYPLKYAYYSKNEEIFSYLLNNGADYNKKDLQDISILKHAIQNRNYRILKYILKKPIHIKEKDVINYHHPFPLMKAICQNNYNEIYSILLKNNFKLDNYSYMNMDIDYSKCPFTPLILSYLLGYQRIFKLLIQYSNINDLDFYGYSLLHYAILKEDLETINDLIDREVNVNYKENTLEYGHSALDIALTIGNKNIFFALLNSKNIFFNIRNNGGELPLSTIIKSKYFTTEDKMEMMENLIKKGSFINNFIDVNIPLKSAIQNKNLPLVELLIKYGANVNFIYEKNGYTPIIYAIEAKSFPIVKFLVEKGADINYVLPQKYDYVKETVLLRSIEIGELNIFEYLLEKNAAISFDNEYENYHLIQTINKSGKTDIFKYLVKHDLNSFSSNIIKSIISLNQLDLLKILISQNFTNNINRKDKNGDTPLAHTIHYNNEYLMDYLIRWGADIHSINNKGETIFDLSYKYSHKLRGHTIYNKIKSKVN
ncbi:ankyrin [Anaeromyces robustus]|uniref:Ankyrin n=1 Tax=Anaeromyces robustus TaxID=1754192 RepID=A0A1Y1WW30_9FUNG|nr:ankyrin [Anaeromyces robustus]|eukprot:ORX77406.1 ankyrin [Anaeromyces robustus]